MIGGAITAAMALPGAIRQLWRDMADAQYMNAYASAIEAPRRQDYLYPGAIILFDNDLDLTAQCCVEGRKR